MLKNLNIYSVNASTDILLEHYVVVEIIYAVTE
jgi:hypothetical protein